MKYFVILFSLSFVLFSCQGQPSSSSSESTIILLENFESNFVDPRNVEIFLPKGYDPTAKKQYKVLYMHDGQNVFNPETSYTKIDWGVDEAIDSLMALKKIEPTIVVASWNNGQKRFPEYMPKAPAFITASDEAKTSLKQNFGVDSLLSDDYLKFLVKELKPYIERNYNVSKKVEDNSIMGSSMGGLISLYAICEYPNEFGAAGCVSTHWPVPMIGGAYMNTLPESLPSPNNHRIYFDYGTKTLDSLYEPHQKKVDLLMRDAGYIEGENWVTKKFEGADHSEKSWRARVHIPLLFLLN
ncbi:alpha/beta hydrolase [Sungkyunkwania multivorans]|uniref:Alpha/beta hydrolase n=1 Tax=Sungkyunkwania multivorans TaxID=1173618 RepID=A0ABW3CV57_9FLAO